MGGEGWPWPSLNRRIDFTSEVRAVSGSAYCVADLLWVDQRVDIEVNGMAYHADAQGFTRESGRRAALEAMGYTVLEIAYRQMADLESLDIMMETFAQRLGFPLRTRTVEFIERRRRLHKSLFGNGSKSA